jgi:two-component system sensor histidine kinase YesM
VEPGIEENLIFPFLLQPIVENAIFHGIGPLQRRGMIKVTLRTSKGTNLAIVEDDGVGLDETSLGKLMAPGGETEGADRLHKIGIRNVYERLKLQFGDSADMTVESTPGYGTKVTIKWPVKQEREVMPK